MDYRPRSLRAVERFEARRIAREARGKSLALAERAVWIAVGVMLLIACLSPGLLVIWRML